MGVQSGPPRLQQARVGGMREHGENQVSRTEVCLPVGHDAGYHAASPGAGQERPS